MQTTNAQHLNAILRSCIPEYGEGKYVFKEQDDNTLYVWCDEHTGQPLKKVPLRTLEDKEVALIDAYMQMVTALSNLGRL